MKIVKISMDLIISDDDLVPYMGTIDSLPEKIAKYITNKLYTDPEFFGEFGPENIESIKEFE